MKRLHTDTDTLSTLPFSMPLSSAVWSAVSSLQLAAARLSSSLFVRLDTRISPVSPDHKFTPVATTIKYTKNNCRVVRVELKDSRPHLTMAPTPVARCYLQSSGHVANNDRRASILTAYAQTVCACQPHCCGADRRFAACVSAWWVTLLLRYASSMSRQGASGGCPSSHLW